MTFDEVLYNAKTAEDISDLTEHLIDWCEYNDFDTIDDLFKRVKVEELTPLIMVALLRNTYMYRHCISEWDTLLYNVQRCMIASELDYKRILRGLI